MSKSLNAELVSMGDSALMVRFGNKIDRNINQKVRNFSGYLHSHPFPGMVEAVPAYTTVTVYYDPGQLHSSGTLGGETCQDWVKSRISEALQAVNFANWIEPAKVVIPVCYGGVFGPDLANLAASKGLEPEEVVRIHTSGDYTVCLIGFAPGFPYLGGLSSEISAPRLSTPRQSVPAGSVGIAGLQTGVYPLEMPGGWQIIGRTPIELFLPERNPPCLLQVGDQVNFVSISEQEFEQLKGMQQ